MPCRLPLRLISVQGEYAAISTNPDDVFGSDGRLMYPTVQSRLLYHVFLPTCDRYFYLGAVGEAAYMTGFERNADIVFGASYAPLLMNLADYQWASCLTRSVSFHHSCQF